MVVIESTFSKGRLQPFSLLDGLRASGPPDAIRKAPRPAPPRATNSGRIPTPVVGRAGETARVTESDGGTCPGPLNSRRPMTRQSFVIHFLYLQPCAVLEVSSPVDPRS